MAALTRANAEAIVVGRVGPLMSEAGMAITVAGANADLNDPLAWACRQAGGSTATHSTVTSAEVSALPVASYDDFVDLGEYRTVLTIIGNLNDVDITTGPRSEKLSQLVEQAERHLEHLAEGLADFLLDAPTAGYITLDFAEHGELRLG